MPAPDNNSASHSGDEEVWIAISAFEKILEAIPNDRTSLEALCNAYAQIGDHTRAMDYVMRLSNVLLDESDMEAVQALVEEVRPYADMDLRARELVERVEQRTRQSASGFSPSAPIVDPAEPSSLQGPHLSAAFSMADELTLAWALLEAKELTQEEYAGVVQDLSDMSTSDSISTISVLHALEFKSSKNLDRVLGFIAESCETPLIALSGFNLPTEAATALPREFMVRRGVMVFDFLSRDALVVLLNPYDKQLRSDVAEYLGRTCHFYICRASEFDSTVMRIDAMVKPKADRDSAKAGPA